MNKNFRNLFATILVALSFGLTACGGGGDSSPEPEKKASFTLHQVEQSVVALPGETMRLALFTGECESDDPEGRYCKEPALIGQIEIETNLDLENIKLVYAGKEVMGYYTKTDNGYLFTPFWQTSFYEAASMEVTGTVSPYSAGDQKSMIKIRVATPSIDKTIGVSGESEVQVIALPEHAPAVVTATASDFPGKSEREITGGMNYSCKQTVSNYCRLDSFRLRVFGMAPFEVAKIVVSNLDYVVEITADEDGTVDTVVHVSAWVYGGDSVDLSISTTFIESGYMVVSEIKSLSGGKEIAPQVPKSCTMVSPNYCKG